MTVFRSSKHIYAQLIDDLNRVTLVSASSNVAELRNETSYGGNIKAAVVVGKKLAEEAKGKGILKAAFDRGHYRFHGRVKALADAAAAAGLKFRGEGRKPKKQKAAPEKPKTAPKKQAK